MSVDSIFLDCHLDCQGDAGFENFLQHIEVEIKALGTIKRWHRRHIEHLRLILLNIIRCHQADPKLFVAYSRMKNRYVIPARYAESRLKYDSVIKITDALWKELGYVRGLIGFYDRTTGKGRFSKLKAKTKLLDTLETFRGKDPLKIIRKPFGDIIILKDENKQLVDYVDSPVTNLMRRNLEEINSLIGGNFIGLYVTDEMLADINVAIGFKATRLGKSAREVLDFSKNRLVRIFNNSSFEAGGRFYRGWWQAVPSRYRKHIRINDVSTCELDFSGLHINMLYAMEGLPLPTGDVYSLKGVPKAARPILKIALQTLLNSSSLTKAQRAFASECPRKEYPDIFTSRKITHKSLIVGLMDKHKPLARYFASGYGVKLQFTDSQIAETVLLALGQRGIVALPVHDSFIVQSGHKRDLLDAMDRAVASAFGHSFNIKEDETAFSEGMSILVEEVMPEDLPRNEEEFERIWVAEPHAQYMAQRKAWLTATNS